MKEEEVILYTCEHCKKKRLIRRHAMVLHEKLCKSNPANWRACSDCVNLEEVSKQYTYEEGMRSTNAFKCRILDKMVYPPKAERKNLPERYPETFKDQIPMPQTCEHHSIRFYQIMDEEF